jgi:hypothetical protein
LKPLPAIAPDLGTWHRVSVHKDRHAQLERILYSAPFALVGQTLWLRATDAAVALYEDYRHVATHPRGQSTIVTSNLDFPEWDQAYPSNRLLASASLDRLRHNAHGMVLDGASYRAPRTTDGRVKSAPAKTAT